MLGVLVESRRARERSLGGTMFSVGLHLVLIAVAVTAKVRADSETLLDHDPPPLVFQLAPPATTAAITPNQTGGWSDGSPRLPRWFDVDVDLPPVEGPTIDLPSIEFGGEPTTSARRGTTVGTGTLHDDVHFEWMVDVPAVPRSGNPSPAYPRVLRDAGIEGTVLAQFVVDTSGRVDPASIRALTATHALFEHSVREAITRMRFRPAESGGRKVRLLVQQSFAFRLER